MRVIRKGLRRFSQRVLGRLDMIEQDALEFHRLHGRGRTLPQVDTPQGKTKLPD